MKKRAIGEAGWGGTAVAGIVGFIYFFPVLFIILTAFRTRSDTLQHHQNGFLLLLLKIFIIFFIEVWQTAQNMWQLVFICIFQ